MNGADEMDNARSDYERERMLYNICKNIHIMKVLKCAAAAPAIVGASNVSSATAGTGSVPAASASATSNVTAGSTLPLSTGSAPPAQASPQSRPPSSHVGNNVSSPPNDSGPSDEVTETQGALVSEVTDPDWNEVGTFGPLLIYHSADDKWEKVIQEKTRLRLQTSRTDASRHRMIARDFMGKPLVNMSIPANMSFVLSKVPAKGGQGDVQFANILFMGTNNANRGAEKFSIKVRFAEGQRLHQKLTELA